MRSLLLIVLSLFLLNVTPALASDYVACVQRQMSALGYAAGGGDGVIGPRTRRAATALKEELSDNIRVRALPAFEERTAKRWCVALGKAYPQVRRFHPQGEAAGLVIEVQSVEGEYANALVRELVGDVIRFYREGWGIELAAQPMVAASEDPGLLTAKINELSQRSGNGPILMPASRLRDICARGLHVAGISYPDVIGLCWKPPATTGLKGKRWAKSLRMELGALITHEYMHQIQHVLTREDVAGVHEGPASLVMGPEWMLEGSAEFFELRYWRKRMRGFQGPSLKDLQQYYLEGAKPISEMRLPGSVWSTPEYRVSLLGVELLAARSGEQSIFDYWEAIGRGLSWKDAFAEAFGVSLAQFETQFTEIAQDYGQMTRFAAGK